MKRIKSAIVGLLLLFGGGCAAPVGLGETVVNSPSSLDIAIRATAALVDPTREGRVFCAGVFIGDRVVTAAHCVVDDGGEAEESAYVSVYGEADESGNHFPRSWQYRVLVVDPVWDIAVLDGGSAPHESLHVSQRSVVRGEHVAAIGHPFGLTWSVSDGIVSAPRRVEPDGYIYTQVTAPVSPGNSGGPLLSMDGDVVGICSIRVMGEAHLGGFVPVDRVRAILTRADLAAISH